MLFEEVHEEITKSNVNNLLSRYHNIKRMAGSYSPKITAAYSATPRSNTGMTSDSTGDTVNLKAKALEKLIEIDRAFESLSAEAKNRLHYKYMSEDRLYDYQIYNAQNISKDTYYRELGKAQLEFAEAYNGGELMVFDYKREKSD